MLDHEDLISRISKDLEALNTSAHTLLAILHQKSIAYWCDYCNKIHIVLYINKALREPVVIDDDEELVADASWYRSY